MGEAAVKKATAEHLVIAAGVAIAGLCVWHATQKAGGPSIPAFTEDVNDVFAGHLASASELHQVTWTRHRYPARTGGEITAVIHGGWSQARIPDVPGSGWMTRPPAEEPLLS